LGRKRRERIVVGIGGEGLLFHSSLNVKIIETERDRITIFGKVKQCNDTSKKLYKSNTYYEIGIAG
jgi:hypothetical protein